MRWVGVAAVGAVLALTGCSTDGPASQQAAASSAPAAASGTVVDRHWPPLPTSPSQTASTVVSTPVDVANDVPLDLLPDLGSAEMPVPEMTVELDPAGSVAAGDVPRSSDLIASSEGTVPVLPVAAVKPRLLAVEADFADPLTVARTWFEAWCWQPATGAANQNIATAGQWTTDVGHQSDIVTAVSDDQWAAVVAAGMSSGCTGVSAVVSHGAPTAVDAVWVEVEAVRVWTTPDGAVVNSQTVAQTRQILKDGGGQWKIDKAVLAG